MGIEGWQPIDTAPKQEWINTVLVSRDKGNECVMAAVFDGDVWRALTITGLMVFRDPTHWMPLPPPPTKES